jgi:hypothetical protein
MVTWGLLTRHLRPVRRIQPPAADLSQRIHSSLGEGPAVGPRLALFGIEHASERGDQDLAGLGIEVAIDPHHALGGGGDVETPKLEHTLGVLFRLAVIDGLPPVGHGALEIVDAERPRRLHERFLHA